MMGDPPGKDQSEQDVLRKLEDFKIVLAKNSNQSFQDRWIPDKLLRMLEDFKIGFAKNSKQSFQDLWIPDKLLHDAEADDMLVWLLLRHCHEKIGSTLDVRVQLPLDNRLNDKEQCWSNQRSTTVFRDPDSKNLEPSSRFTSSRELQSGGRDLDLRSLGMLRTRHDT